MTPEALLDLFVLAPVGVLEMDGDGRVGMANLAARNLLQPFIGTPTLDDLFLALGATAPDVAARVRQFEGPRGVVAEAIEVLAPASGRGVTLSVLKLAPNRFVTVIADASAVAHARATIDLLSQRVQAIGSAVREHAIFTIARDGAITSWSDAAERVHQWSASAAMGQSMAQLLAEETGADAQMRHMLAEAERSGWSEDNSPRRRSDGSRFDASTVLTALRSADGETTGFSVVTRDLATHRQLETASREDASSDVDFFTGATNRRSFFEVASTELARARRYGHALSLLLVAPDNFRAVSAAQGETFAAEWLRTIASLCRQESRTIDVVGRVGGEEFAVLLPSTDLPGGLVLGERIRERMQRHVFGGASSPRCTVSVGVADATDTITSCDMLLNAASTAVERAKQAGMNLVVGYDA